MDRHFESPDSVIDARRELRAIAMELSYLREDQEANPEDVDNLNARAEYIRQWIAEAAR